MHATKARRAFTLIELLVVMIIIAIVIAIVLPVLGHVRDNARLAGTKGMMEGLNQAILQFNNDERRMPGYFSERDMGFATNATTNGFTSLENILLDLMGVEVKTTGTTPSDVQVGPGGVNNDATGFVDLDLIGSEDNAHKSYYNPDGKFYVPQTSPSQVATMAGTPDLLDYWGTPYLAWRQDDSAVGTVTQVTQFAKEGYAAGPNGSARFYYNSNAGFLKSNQLGRRAADQLDLATGSVLNTPNTADKAKSLAGFLGHPAYPYRAPNATLPPDVPAAARGQIVIHSAGQDGIYFGRKDRGARQFDLTARNFLDYAVNFAPNPTMAVGPGNQYTNSSGQVDSNDITRDFDDMLSTAGN
jgi:prepilin-type N-terminal cleavage/methylation domain-containing protein